MSAACSNPTPIIMKAHLVVLQVDAVDEVQKLEVLQARQSLVASGDKEGKRTSRSLSKKNHCPQTPKQLAGHTSKPSVESFMT